MLEARQLRNASRCVIDVHSAARVRYQVLEVGKLASEITEVDKVAAACDVQAPQVRQRGEHMRLETDDQNTPISSSDSGSG